MTPRGPLAWLLAGVIAVPAWAAPGTEVTGALEERVDALVREGFDHPARALQQLAELRAREQGAPALLFLRAQAVVEAQAGHAAQAGKLAEQLLALSHGEPPSPAAADANLVRALVAETAGQLDVAAALAQAAADAYDKGCAVPAFGSMGASGAGRPAVSAACDYRSLWRAQQVLERHALGVGQPARAQEHARAAHDLADRAGDAPRKALALASLAYDLARDGQPEAAQRAIAQAKRMAAALSDPVVMARVRLNEARVADQRGDVEASLHATEEALGLAQRADAKRLAAILLGNLSDLYVKRRRPAEALRAAQDALPTMREFGDLRAELVLINNAGLAKIGLHRVAEGKQDLVHVLELCERSGQTGSQAEVLKEFGEALAAVGDARGALELYHRERALSAELMQGNRQLALKEMQARYDTEAERHRIELARSDNALKSAALANRGLRHRIWLLAAAVMVLATAAAALLYRRVRETHRALAASHAQLRRASERDPLTQLANRRHFHAFMKSREAASPGYRGALLAIDIDHFKRINDAYGHAAGDAVLVEVARRLSEAVREADLVVRWGGEEFLVATGTLDAAQADALAERILASVGGTPIMVQHHAVRITASIGYACFPLPRCALALSWERAVNLADMALYAAKGLGRNRAVGIAAAEVADLAALRAIEGDFERAWHEGRVMLRQAPGPAG